MTSTIHLVNCKIWDSKIDHAGFTNMNSSFTFATVYMQMFIYIYIYIYIYACVCVCFHYDFKNLATSFIRKG